MIGIQPPFLRKQKKEKIMAENTSNRGFALMDEIASKGGHESSGNFKSDPQRVPEAGRKEAGRKDGRTRGGSFANDRERAAEAGRQGGGQH
jgi:general stress protein YciG